MVGLEKNENINSVRQKCILFFIFFIIKIKNRYIIQGKINRYVYYFSFINLLMIVSLFFFKIDVNLNFIKMFYVLGGGIFNIGIYCEMDVYNCYEVEKEVE